MYTTTKSLTVVKSLANKAIGNVQSATGKSKAEEQKAAVHANTAPNLAEALKISVHQATKA